MVANKIDVYSLSSRPDAVALHWTSDGHGTYTIEEVPDMAMDPGTKVVVHLKPNCAGNVTKKINSLLYRY
jgi:TNF receptor-associated protein 1